MCENDDVKTGGGDEREGHAQVYSGTVVERSASWLAQSERSFWFCYSSDDRRKCSMAENSLS